MISIVTPTFNEIDNIKDLIFAVKKEMIDNKLIYEHIIIDNNSKDLSLKVARELGVHTIANNKNLGFSLLDLIFRIDNTSLLPISKILL